MNRYEREAFNVAKDILVAKVSNTNIRADGDGGQAIGDCFEAIYTKLLQILNNSLSE